jgi:hypothetical protein
MPKAEKEQSKLFWLSIKLLNDVNPCKLGSVLQFRKFPESSKISNSFVLKNPSTNTKCEVGDVNIQDSNCRATYITYNK